MTMLRVLTFSTLFPSSVRPSHGIFVETRLRELVASGSVQARVVAPVPWFFSTDARFGEYGRMAKTPDRESRNGLDVLHPRYFLLPRVGTNIAPLTLALSARRAAHRLMVEGFNFDLIDAHYYYPDGVAAALLGKWLRKPVVVTARGSDLNLIAQYCLPEKMMRWAATYASASIGVSDALVRVLRNWGLPEEKLHVMRNGVDLNRFRPMPPIQAKAKLGLDAGPILLSIGNMVTHKGHDIVIRALASISDRYPLSRLVIVGTGPEQQNLESLAVQLGIGQRVLFTGELPNEELLYWYSAADMLVLASSREGWPNVLLESMACGTPVVATNVGGIPEIIGQGVAGRLVPTRDIDSFTAQIHDLLMQPPSREQVRGYAEKFHWRSTTNAQIALFENIVHKARLHPHA